MAIFKNEGSTTDGVAVNIEKAFGTYLWDVNGNRYFDLFAQTWSMPLGHNNKRVIDSVKNQLEKVTHLRTAYSTKDKADFAELLVGLAPKSLTKVNFSLHGSLANEGAMKLAINSHDSRHKILYLEDGFHGRSFATMGVSWKGTAEKYHQYFNHGVEVKKNLADIEKKMIEEQPAAIILELVQGNCGFKILDESLAKGIRRLCDIYDVVMIVDEIQTAFGCVEEMFMSSRYGIEPDIVTFGKAIGGGFPLAGLLYKEKFAFQPGQHSFTFGHSPISFAAGKAFIAEIKKESYKAKSLNICIQKHLDILQKKHQILGETRCIGTKAAFDIATDNQEDNISLANLIVKKMFACGVIISTSRYKGMGNSIMLQAPLISKIKDLEIAFEKLDLIIEEVTTQSEEIDQPISILNLEEDDIFKDDPPDIVEHSKRHALISEIIARKMQFNDSYIEILKRAAWVHDIGGFLKHEYTQEQRFLLQLEFTKADKCKLNSKPSFNPKLCIAHAKERVEAGLRKKITTSEIANPFLLYLEEFELLKGEPLSSKERKLLKTWWNHPQYSIDLLEKRNIAVTPEIEILVRCNEQPWLFEESKRVTQCIAKSVIPKQELKTLLAIMRVADIIENGNNRSRRNLRGVEVEDWSTTIEFVKNKFKLDGLDNKNCMEVISAIEQLIDESNELFIDTILKSRQNYIELEADFSPGLIATKVHDSIETIKNRTKQVANYKYSSTNELSVLYEDLWYKFSFVPERKGEYDTPMLLSQVQSEEINGLKVPHVDPEGRKCPFCYPNIDELICKLKLSSNNVYSFLVNIDPYAEEHLVMAGEKNLPQILSESHIIDILVASYALGEVYEGSFTSFSGASIKHFHSQFYKVKTPIWRNLSEKRIEIINQHHVDDVVSGELANCPAKTIIIKGRNRTKVAEQVWEATHKLMKENKAYNTKFMYSGDGDYIWLIAPRVHGFMAYAGTFLSKEDELFENHYSGCGSIESPGLDAIMFFDVPENISLEQQQFMAQKFAKTLRETSDWDYKHLSNRKSLSQLYYSNGLNGSKVAHRIESIAAAHKAIKENLDLLEVDVQLTRDHQLVAFWGSVESFNGPDTHVFELSFEELCSRLGKRILKLEELCRFVNGRVSYSFDLKDWSDNVAQYQDSLIAELVRFTRYFNLQNDILFESFNENYILALKTAFRNCGINLMGGLAVHKNNCQNQVVEKIIKTEKNGLSTIFIPPNLLSQDIANALNTTNMSLITTTNAVNPSLLKSIFRPQVDVVMNSR